MSMDEPIEFTRMDGERIRVTEASQAGIHEKLDGLTDKIDAFLSSHAKEHVDLDKRVECNSRFRRNTIRVLVWAAGSGLFTTALAAGAKAMGWLP
jgi:ribosome-associated translation inhibitor RaiA